MDKAEVLSRSRDALRALEAGVELSTEERWACYEAVQFYLDWNKEDDEEADPGGKDYAYGDEPRYIGVHPASGGDAAFVTISYQDHEARTVLESPTKGQVRRLVKALGAIEDKS